MELTSLWLIKVINGNATRSIRMGKCFQVLTKEMRVVSEVSRGGESGRGRGGTDEQIEWANKAAGGAAAAQVRTSHKTCPAAAGSTFGCS